MSSKIVSLSASVLLEANTLEGDRRRKSPYQAPTVRGKMSRRGSSGRAAAWYFSLTGSRTIKFYAYAFTSSLQEVTASLMHELNNAAAGWKMPYYDSTSLGGNGPKGSYTSAKIARRAYDAQCK